MKMKLTRTLLAGIAVAGLTVSGAQAADLLVRGIDPIYNSPLFNFEGFYVGGTAGVGAFPGPGVVGMVGVVVGANFAVTDAILAGVEFQGDTLWNGGGFQGFDTLFLGKLGGYLSDEMIVYGSAGGGWIAGTPSYAFGAGIEMAVADQLSARGELMATGSWGGWPDGAKATVGLLWHMN
jgi:outer membrane immunogenic protein